MADERTTILYALSTFAQTCAALAALVGAIGLYRLQALSSRHEAMYSDIYAAIGRPTATREKVLEAARGHALQAAAIRDLLHNFEAIKPRFRSALVWLTVFETWNLVVVAASLVGFNYIDWLVMSRAFTFWAIWAAAGATIILTASSVFAWTKSP